MTSACAGVSGPLLLPLLLIGLLARAGAQTYSRLPPGFFCEDYGLVGVPNEDECFNSAAPYLSLGSVPTVTFNDLSFNGCVYNIFSNTIFFGNSSNAVALATLSYLCIGHATSTTTSVTATTITQTSTVTEFAFTTPFTLINFGQVCADYQVEDITSGPECLTGAAPYVGLTAFPDPLDGFGFTGCVYNPTNGQVFYGVTAGVTGIRSDLTNLYRLLCRGEATTTTSTTSSTTSTTVTQTTTLTTSTLTTSTLTTVTSTTTSSMTTTFTLTTSTLTTSTLTTSTLTTTTNTTSTSTETSSTSTVTTQTYTGSTSTLSTTTSSTTSSTVTTTITTETFTTTTSTRTTTTRPLSAFVGEDPITYYDNVMRKFWLPEGQLVPLFHTPELKLLGLAKTVGAEQYIRKLEVQGPRGEIVMQVSIQEGLDKYRMGDLDDLAFQTLNVTLGEWAAPNGYHMSHRPGPDAYAHRWGSLAFAFQQLADAWIGEARAELVVVGGTSATILIMSVAANDEDGQLSAKFAHLDFVLQMKQRHVCEGILPEVWGLRPMSDHTQLLLEDPNNQMLLNPPENVTTQ